MRADIDLVRADVLSVRLEAVIGEKSVIEIAGVIGEKSTLALGTPAIAALFITRQLVEAISDLGNAIGRLGTAPALDPLRTAGNDLLVSLSTLHSEMEARYRELAALDATLPGTEALAHVDAREIHLVPGLATVHGILEGAPGHTGGAGRVTCGGATMPPIAVGVIDQDGGGDLGSGTPPLTLAIASDRPTPIRIDVSAISFYDLCRVEIEGRRHFRAAPIALTSAEISDLGMRSVDWDMRMTILGGQIAMMGTEGTADEIAVAPEVEAFVRELTGETGAWRAIPATMSPEDADMLGFQIAVTSALSLAIEANPALAAGAFGPSVTAALAALRAHDDAAIAALTGP
jgi:hypothetical protein